METNNEQEMEIDLKEIFVVLLDRIWIIIGAGIILAILSGIITKIFITPMYSSTTKLYVINRQNDDSSVTYSDLQTGSSLTNDYVIQVTGNKVLSQVIENLYLDTTVSELQDRVTASNPDNTRYIVITVEDADPVVAQQIAESVASVSAEVVMEVMDIEKVNVAEEANLPTTPSSPNFKKNIILGGACGIILAVVIIIVVYLLNDSIRTPEDVKKYLGLNTIGQIPILESKDVKKHKKRKRPKESEAMEEAGEIMQSDTGEEAPPDIIMPEYEMEDIPHDISLPEYVKEAEKPYEFMNMQDEPEKSEDIISDNILEDEAASEAAVTENIKLEKPKSDKSDEKNKNGNKKKKSKKKKSKKKNGSGKNKSGKTSKKSQKEDGSHE